MVGGAGLLFLPIVASPNGLRPGPPALAVFCSSLVVQQLRPSLRRPAVGLLLPSSVVTRRPRPPPPRAAAAEASAASSAAAADDKRVMISWWRSTPPALSGGRPTTSVLPQSARRPEQRGDRDDHYKRLLCPSVVKDTSADHHRPNRSIF